MQGQARWEWGRWSWPECRGGKNPEEPRPRQYPGDLQDRVQTYYCVNMPLNSKSGDSQNVPEYIWVYRKSQYWLFSPTWGAVRDIRILEKSKDSLMWWLITEETKGEMWQIILMQRWKRKEKKISYMHILVWMCQMQARTELIQGPGPRGGPWEHILSIVSIHVCKLTPITLTGHDVQPEEVVTHGGLDVVCEECQFA